MEDNETVTLITKCSTLIQNKLPPKLKDSGSFKIPYEIDVLSFDKALYGIWASFNLMPLTVYKKLDLCDMNPTNISLQLADKTVKYALRVL